MGEASKLAAAYITRFNPSLGPLKASTVEKWCEGLPTWLEGQGLTEEEKARGREYIAWLKDKLDDGPEQDAGERR